MIPSFVSINLRLIRYASFVASSIAKNEHCHCKLRTITHPGITDIDINAGLTNAFDGNGVLGTGK